MSQHFMDPDFDPGEELRSMVAAEPPVVETKNCGHCNRDLPVSEYWKKGKGLQAYCKTCQGAKVKLSMARAAERDGITDQAGSASRYSGECELCHKDINRKMKSHLILKNNLICGYCYTFRWEPFQADSEAYMALLHLVANS